MRRGALISFLVHVALLLAVLIVLPPEVLPQAADQSVDVDLVGPSAPQESNAKGKTAAPDVAPVFHQAPMAQKPKPQAIISPPPPPPPPPLSQATHVPPKPMAQPTPPPPPVVTPTHAVTPPPPPKHPPQPKHAVAATPPSPTHQQHAVKAPMPLSQSVLNTLLDLKEHQPQTKAPTAQYNPDAGGAPDAGGSKTSTANSGLTGADRDAIGNHVRPCWNIDSGAPGVAGFNIQLLVTTDATGIVRQAVVAPQDQSKLSDPIQAAYANDAINAVMNYQCANLPLPPDMMGKVNTFLFDFTP